jgi:biotin carboxyl carrier protein
VNLEIVIQGRSRSLRLEHDPEQGTFICELDGKTLKGSARLIESGILSLIIGGDSYLCVLDQTSEEASVLVNGKRYGFLLDDPRSLKKKHAGGSSHSGPMSIKASMPGRVIRVLVESGDQVSAKQGILVIEAMKMQNEIKAPRGGKILELRAVPGATVNAGDVLAVIEQT